MGSHHDVGDPPFSVYQEAYLAADLKGELTKSLRKLCRYDVTGWSPSAIEIGQAADLIGLQSAHVPMNFDYLPSDFKISIYRILHYYSIPEPQVVQDLLFLVCVCLDTGER
jgi:hypothetical protein